MGEAMIDGLALTPLRIISVPEGDVLHAMKNIDPGYAGFGEAYFSTIKEGAIKAWKRHRRMTLNLVVPVGAVRFVLYDDRPSSPTRGVFQTVELSRDRYSRLTVPPGLWMGFKGLGAGASLLLNVADMAHDPDEMDRRAMDEISFDWSGRP